MYETSNMQGILRNQREQTSKPLLVKLTEEQWEDVEDALDKFDGYVDAKVIMKELGISKKTLCNLVCSGKISPDMYTEAVNGVRKYDFNKIMGVRK